MRKSILSLALLAIACVLPAMPAQAQTRVFVAAQGSDGNPCTFALPCRTFQHAHDTVAAGGEIDVLDPAGYGKLTITKSIRIEGHGFAGITASSSGDKAIYITASGTDRITLRGLNIDGGGVALDGVNSQTVGFLSVEDCEIHDFTGTAIFVTGSAGTNLVVSNTRAMNSQNGIYVWPAVQGVTAALTRVEVSKNQNGITARSTDVTGGAQVWVSVTDSVLANNNVGFYAFAPPSSFTALIYIMRSTVFTPSSRAIWADGGVIAVGRSLLAGTMVSTGGGLTSSYGDNGGAATGTINQTTPYF